MPKDVLSRLGRIRVKGLPEGTAPEDVRRLWDGLELPCLYVVDDHNYGGESGELADAGKRFVVPQKEALLVLGNKDRAAAEWWYGQGYPLGREEDGLFSFGVEHAEVVTPPLSHEEFRALATRLGQLA